MINFKTGITFGAGFTLGSTILGVVLTPLVTVAHVKINEIVIDKFVE